MPLASSSSASGTPSSVRISVLYPWGKRPAKGMPISPYETYPRPAGPPSRAAPDASKAGKAEAGRPHAAALSSLDAFDPGTAVPNLCPKAIRRAPLRATPNEVVNRTAPAVLCAVQSMDQPVGVE